MPDVTLTFDDKGQPVGQLPPEVETFIKRERDKAFGLGAERSAKDAMAQLEAERAKLKASDPVAGERLKAMEDELAALKLAEAERKQEYDKASQMRDERHAKALEAEKQARARYDARLRDMLRAEVRAAAAQHGARPESLPELERLLTLDLDLDDNLNPRVIDPATKQPRVTADNTPMSVPDFVRDYLASHPHHVAAPAPGMGAAGGHHARGGQKADPQQQAAATAQKAVLDGDRSLSAIDALFEATRQKSA